MIHKYQQLHRIFTLSIMGYGLFESDSDLDIVEAISVDIAEITNEKDMQLFCPKDFIYVVDKLNGGAFHQLLKDYQAKEWKHGVILLGAVTMQLGGHISDDDMDILRVTLETTPMTEEAKRQMATALKEYKNDGKLWDFGSKGLL